MELELKHLSPYLPHGLRYSFNNHEYWKITAVDPTSPKYDLGEMVRLTITGDNNIGVKWDDEKSGLTSHFAPTNEYFKPILRSMSDYIDINSSQMNDLDGDIKDQIWIQSFALKQNSLASISYSAYELMVRNHVDCFRLVDSGLAIDINTL